VAVTKAIGGSKVHDTRLADRCSLRKSGLLRSIFYGHMYAYMLRYMLMKRTALFLKEQQLTKLQTLSEKTGAPIAELVRRAIDAYLLSRNKELK
jgi:hypothetical protein